MSKLYMTNGTVKKLLVQDKGGFAGTFYVVADEKYEKCNLWEEITGCKIKECFFGRDDEKKDMKVIVLPVETEIQAGDEHIAFLVDAITQGRKVTFYIEDCGAFKKLVGLGYGK